MNIVRSNLLLWTAALLFAACGSPATPTPAGGGGGGTPTQPGGGGLETQSAGGGGGGSGTKPAGWDRYGKVTYSISGPASASGELGFAPASSVFAGTQVSLTFNDDASGAIMSLRLDGANGFAQFGDGKIVFTSEQCTMKDLRQETGSASGGFDCTGPVIVESGAIMTGGRMAGTFTARVN